MNYKAFYRTYRPTVFSQVVGQEHIVKTLINKLKMGKISHGYLFSGPRGTGKTSIARIFANALNCIHSESPENICQSCLDNSAKSLDIIEIDAASNNSVNDIRIIREQVNFAPTNNPYKIYIIDEVHMLSNSAFNSLLMTLEEPPKHAIFILATTDPEKIPDTILSRVQRYNFKRITKNYLKEQLNFIFNKENIKCEEEALDLIVSLANGSLRDALSIADQVSAYSNSDIKKDDIIEIFGLTSIDSQIELINYIANKDVGNALNFFDNLLRKGIDVIKLTSSLINILKDFLIFKKTGNVSLLSVTSEVNISKITIKSDNIYMLLDVLVPLSNEIKYSEIPHQLFQLSIIKLCSIEGNLKDVVAQKAIKSIDKTQPINIEKEKTFDDITPTRDIESDMFIKKETNTSPSSTQTDEKTLLSDFNTFELKKRFDSLNEDIEFEVKDDNLQTTKFDEVDLVKNNENDKKFDTDELIQNSTMILNVSNEENGIVNEVDESILDSTNELDIQSNEKEIYDTNEINLLDEDEDVDKKQNEKTKEFKINDKSIVKEEIGILEKETSNKEYKLTQPNIINLFLLAEKETFSYFKEKMTNAANASDEGFGIFITLFKEARFVCSAQNFLLVSSNENWVINDLNDFKQDEKFNQFISIYFGSDVHLFAITRKDYEDTKKLFAELKKTGQLPRKYNLPLKNTQKFQANTDLFDAEFGNTDEHHKVDLKTKALFGPLFKKK